GSLKRTVYCSRLLWVNTGDSLSLGELWGRGEQGARGRSVALQFGIAFGAGRRVAADGAGGRDQAARDLRLALAPVGKRDGLEFARRRLAGRAGNAFHRGSCRDRRSTLHRSECRRRDRDSAT